VLTRSAAAWERVGAVLWPGFSGVVIVEAVKEVYAALPRAEKQRFARLKPAMFQTRPNHRDLPPSGSAMR